MKDKNCKIDNESKNAIDNAKYNDFILKPIKVEANFSPLVQFSINYAIR